MVPWSPITVTSKAYGIIHSIVAEMRPMAPLANFAMAVVVGGKMSANTRRLVEVFEKAKMPVQHVESEKDIRFEAFNGLKVIGVAAGASTPPEVVERVIEAIEKAQ